MSRRGGGRRPESGSEQHASASFVQRGGGRGTRGSAGGRSGGFQSPAPSSVSGRGQTPTPVAVQVSSSRTAQCASASSSASDPLLGAAQYPASSSSTDALSKELKKLTLQSPPVSSKAVKFPSRPSFGTEGNKCLVKANHFLVQLADTELHHYDVSITPEVVSKSLNREVISQLVDMYRESHLGKRTPAYDGRKSIYTAGPLPFSSKEFVINLPDKKDQPGRARREREFKVAIKFASKPDIHHLRQFLHGKQHDAPQETIQVLDVVLREYPSKNYCVVGRSFFSSKLGPIGELGDGIEYWKGYYQSLRPTQMGLSLNIDVSARPFYESVWVTEFVVKYFNFNDLSRPLSEQNRLKLKKALKGVRVEISYRSCVRSYKITGLSRFPLSETMFSLDDEGTSMSVLEYFHKKYNIPLKYGHLPGIQAGSDSKPIYLPLELCKIVKGQRYTKKLNDRQVTAMLRATCQRPPDREKTINEMLKKNDFKNDRLVKDEFGLDLNEELTMVDARVLRPPRLKYHESGREHDVDPRVGQWNMINKKMINGATVHYWTCVSFSSRLRRDMVFRFCEELVAMCESKGMAFNPQPLLPINSAHSARIESALANIHKQSIDALGEASRSGKRLQLLIIILPDETGSYGKIKRICETELGIVSQCCQPRNAQRLSKQYFENVSLKINVKVGGRNSVLFDAVQRRIPLVTDVPTIILGADVTHPPPGEDSSPSIAAVVASMDWPEITKYRGLVSAQAHREEMIQDLYKFTQDPKRGLVHSGMIRELLISFRRSTGQKPFRIIFYRDGVSEGQFSQVLLFEMDAIRKACASLEENYLPPVTFVVVQKRHHTRFFPTDRSPTDKSGNILPGTVVDTKICHPTEFDFYLNSHAGIQGTSRPTHYHVLYDENRFTADALQTLTNKLCYTYARCTRSVSIVPPAYYAHLAAFRARYYIEGIEVTDSGSAGAGRGTREHTAEVRPLPSIKDNVKDVMFYC